MKLMQFHPTAYDSYKVKVRVYARIKNSLHSQTQR
jgi:hypothetical protein